MSYIYIFIVGQSEKAKNLVWKEEESKDVQKLQRRQSIEKLEQRKYKKKATNVFIDQNIERNLDYYLNTFTDPLELTDENEYFFFFFYNKKKNN